MNSEGGDVRRIAVGDGIYVRVPAAAEAVGAPGADPGSVPEHEPSVGSGVKWAVPPPAPAAAAAGAVATLLVLGATTRGALAAGVVATLVLLAAIDLRWRVIPNRIVLPATGIVLVWQFAFASEASLEWIAAAIGAATFLALPSVVRPGAVGMGDVKLAALLGAALGSGVIGALLVGFLATVPVALVMLARSGRAARHATIPLGPFLAAGATLMLLAA